MNIQSSVVQGTEFGCKHTVETVEPTGEDLGLSVQIGTNISRNLLPPFLG
jgi:hypothetical protein